MKRYYSVSNYGTLLTECPREDIVTWIGSLECESCSHHIFHSKRQYVKCNYLENQQIQKGESKMKKYSELTKNQKEMVQSLIAMDYPTKEIASLVNVPRRSIGVARGNMKRADNLHSRKTYNTYEAN